MADVALAKSDDGTLWLRVDEAAARLGLHPSALRSRVARGQHPHRKDNHGRVLAAVPAGAALPSSDEGGHRHDKELANLRQRVDELTTSLTEARMALVKAVRATLDVARKAAAKTLAKPHERLAVALAAGRVTARQVAEVLRVDPAHVFVLASGRTQLAPTAWRKVFAELEVSIP